VIDFLISREDLHSCRVAETAALEPGEGEAVLSVDTFGLSANNITYAKFGDAMSYWNFFPAADGWGRMPVWGFAVVAASRVPELAAGTRVYGYLPPSSELLVTPARVSGEGFTDASAHRRELPGTYNVYAAVDGDPAYDAEREDQQMLLRPLFYTSFLIDDFLADGELFGASAVVISSASSKTASALAFLLSRRGDVEVIGLSSERGTDFAQGLGVYGHVLAYEQLEELPQGRAVYVDIAGDADVRNRVHERYGEDLAHSAVVGATHHDRMGGVPDSLPGAPPTFFFAPDRVSKRSGEWGWAGLQQRLAQAWEPYVQWTDGWLQIVHEQGPEALEASYLRLLDGRVDPASASVISLEE
jgi:hypothetical protein